MFFGACWLKKKKKKVATHTLVHVQRVDRHLLVTKSQGLTLPLWGVAWPHSGKMFRFSWTFVNSPPKLATGLHFL